MEVVASMEATPRHISPTPDDVDLSEALLGLGALGQTPTPQQLNIARVLCATNPLGRPLYDEAAICVPRRSGKSSAVWAVAIGRCMSRDRYKVAITAQNGMKAASFMRAIADELDRHDPDPECERRRFYKGVGDMRIEWKNGSRLWVVSPREDSYRGDAADLLIFDEAQSHDAELSEALVAAAVPLLDTRPDGQLIVAGTAGDHRQGILWKQLELGRNDPDEFGIVEYAAPEDSDIESDDVLKATHPGITSGLTTLKKIVANRGRMTATRFAQEYLGIWPEDGTSRAIPAQAWADAARAGSATPPERFAIAFECSQTGKTATVVAAWRDDDGRARVQVLKHAAGTAWVSGYVADLSRRRRCAIRYDQVSSNQDTADQLQRVPAVRNRLHPTSTRDTSASQARLAREVIDGNLLHADDGAMNAAVEAAVWKTSERGGRYFRRNKPDDDISPLIAAAQALWEFDATPTRPRVQSKVVI